MSNKKFYTLLSIMAFMFLVVFGSGCGGSDGGGNTEKVGGENEDITEPTKDVSPDITYLVSFDTDGGTPEVPTQTVKDGSYATKPTIEITRNEGEYLEYWCEGSKTGSEFHFETTPIRADTTLYAKWSPVKDEDVKAVEDAIANIKAAFRWGVFTENATFTLPEPDVEDVLTAWTSDNTTVIQVADSGTSATVTRSTSTVVVKLKVTVTKNGALEEYTWNIRVIGTNASTEKASYETIYNRWLRLNSSNTDRRWEDVEGNVGSNTGKPVKSIEGQFSDASVWGEGDASYVLGEISNVLGLDDGSAELTFVNRNIDNRNIDSRGYGAEYAFVQKTAGENGVRYYGRGVTLSVNSGGLTDSLSSNVFTDDAPTSGSDYSEDDAKDALDTLEIYGEGFEVKDSELVIYTLNEYANNAIYARVLNVYGTDAEGVYFNDEVIIASDGTLIDKNTNLHTEAVEATGTNEKNVSESFEVEFSGDKYLMYNAEFNFSVYAPTAEDGNLVTKDTAKWDEATDKSKVSAYVNALKAMQYWRINFKRDSIDGQGGEVKVVVANDSLGIVDNASWTRGQNVLTIYPQSDDAYSYSRAVAVPTMVHETAHGVFEASVGLDFPYKGYTAAINEGYADIFAAIQNRSWQLGKDYVKDSSKCLRNIADPNNANAIERASGDIIVGGIGQDSDPHMASYVVSHAAYLMQQKGLEWGWLELLWYKSMSMGYSATSDFYDVRTNVLKAARKLGLSVNDLDKVKSAFDEVDITDYGAKLYGTVKEFDGDAINGAYVTLTTNDFTSTDASGNYSLEADVGIYNVEVSADGYVTFKQYNVELAPAATNNDTSGDVKLDVELVKPSTETTKGTLTFTAVNATAPTMKVVDASVDIREAWNNVVSGDPIITGKTGEDGSYTVELDAGYYTVRVSHSDYTAYRFNVAIKPSYTSKATEDGNILMSPLFIIVDNFDDPVEQDKVASFRVVLTWGLNPSDLDSHLIAKLSDDTTFHIAYYDKNGYQGGIRVASLDVDDVTSYGPETVSVTSFDKDGNYDYYVHWYAGNGSWATSNAKVTLYRLASNGALIGGESPIEFEVPVDQPGATNTTSYYYGRVSPQYWHVFSYNKTEGFKTVNELKNSTSESIFSLTSSSVVDVFPPKY